MMQKMKRKSRNKHKLQNENYKIQNAKNSKAEYKIRYASYTSKTKKKS